MLLTSSFSSFVIRVLLMCCLLAAVCPAPGPAPLPGSCIMMLAVEDEELDTQLSGPAHFRVLLLGGPTTPGPGEQSLEAVAADKDGLQDLLGRQPEVFESEVGGGVAGRGHRVGGLEESTAWGGWKRAGHGGAGREHGMGGPLDGLYVGTCCVGGCRVHRSGVQGVRLLGRGGCRGAGWCYCHYTALCHIARMPIAKPPTWNTSPIHALLGCSMPCCSV